MKTKQTNKKIGIIGGIGPQATEFIYNKIAFFSQTKYGAKDNDDYPYIIIESVPIPDFISDKKRLPLAKQMLFKTIKTLENAGATKLAITSNTVHILMPELRLKTEVKFLSIIEIVAKKIAQKSYKKVALLGTPVLIKSGVYKNELDRYGIKLLTPKNEEMEILNHMIRSILAGKKEHEKKDEYVHLVNRLFEEGAEAIILGCTELPMAINYEALGEKAINSDAVLAEAIADYYYSNKL